MLSPLNLSGILNKELGDKDAAQSITKHGKVAHNILYQMQKFNVM
jgi:hypothetical protein